MVLSKYCYKGVNIGLHIYVTHGSFSQSTCYCWYMHVLQKLVLKIQVKRLILLFKNPNFNCSTCLKTFWFWSFLCLFSEKGGIRTRLFLWLWQAKYIQIFSPSLLTNILLQNKVTPGWQSISQGAEVPSESLRHCLNLPPRCHISRWRLEKVKYVEIYSFKWC